MKNLICRIFGHKVIHRFSGRVDCCRCGYQFRGPSDWWIEAKAAEDAAKKRGLINA